MVETMENRLQDYYRVFGEGHDRRRAQLMESLSVEGCDFLVLDRPVRFFPIALRSRKVLAAAAVLLILVGVSFFRSQSAPVNSQAAWASAIDNAGQVSSVHLRCSTGSSSLEMWWRRPDHFRMHFSNGNINTHNGTTRWSFDTKRDRLVKSAGGIVGPEMFVLGELGQVFTSNHRLSEKMMKDCVLVSSKEVIYKGEECQELTFSKNAGRRTVIVSVVDAKENFIYDIKIVNASQPEKILYHIEVLDVDQMMPDSLFALVPRPGQEVVERK